MTAPIRMWKPLREQRPAEFAAWLLRAIAAVGMPEAQLAVRVVDGRVTFCAVADAGYDLAALVRALGGSWRMVPGLVLPGMAAQDLAALVADVDRPVTVSLTGGPADDYVAAAIEQARDFDAPLALRSLRRVAELLHRRRELTAERWARLNHEIHETKRRALPAGRN